jgi:hypothetical protein
MKKENICNYCSFDNHPDNFVCENCGWDLDFEINENELGLLEIYVKKDDQEKKNLIKRIRGLEESIQWYKMYVQYFDFNHKDLHREAVHYADKE